MAVQYSDSPAREVPGYWLGDPSAGLRWPFDADFRAWKTGAVLYLPLVIALWLIVPVAALAYLASRAVRRYAAKHVADRTVTIPYWTTRSKVVSYPALAAAFTIAIPVLALPFSALLLPLPIWLAFPVAVPVAVMITRRVMPYLDTNRPYAYWAATLHRVADRPHTRRDPVQAETHVAPDGDDDDDIGLSDLHLLALTTEVTVAYNYRPIAKPVEAFRWNPKDEAHASQVAAWLQQHGTGFAVDRDRWLIVNPSSGLEGVLVKPGCWIMRDEVGTYTSVDDKDFRRAYEAAQ